MFEDHKTARVHVATIRTAIETQDKPSLASHLTAYGKLLKDHIKRENEILNPRLDKQLITESYFYSFPLFRTSVMLCCLPIVLRQTSTKP